MRSHGNTRLIIFVSRVLHAFLQRDYRIAFVQLRTMFYVVNAPKILNVCVELLMKLRRRGTCLWPLPHQRETSQASELLAQEAQKPEIDTAGDTVVDISIDTASHLAITRRILY